MSKFKELKLEDFNLKKVKISRDGVEATFDEKRTIDGTPSILNHSISAKFEPHPDLIRLRDSLKEYVVKAFSLEVAFDTALKFANKGEQTQKIEDSRREIYEKIEITGVSISGDDQLKGAVISAKITSFNDSKCAINTPRIVFSSEKIGIEMNVDGDVELIETEVFKYLFEGKKAQAELFDNPDDSDDAGNVPKAKTIELAPAGLS